MSNNKPLCDCTAQELEEELRKRQLRTYTTQELDDELKKRRKISKNGKSKVSLVAISFKQAREQLDFICASFLQQLQRVDNEGDEHDGDGVYSYEFPREFAMILLEAHPSLAARAFHERTLLSFFLQAKVTDLKLWKDLCKMFKANAPKEPHHRRSQDRTRAWESQDERYQNWKFTFRRQPPNPIADACMYMFDGMADSGLFKLMVDEFPDYLFMKSELRHNDCDPKPCELLLYRFDSSFGYYFDSDEERLKKPSFTEVFKTIEVMYQSCPENTSLLFDEDAQQFELLSLAMNGIYGSGDLLDFLLENVACGYKTFFWPFRMTPNNQAALNTPRILPHLTKFHWHPDNVERDVYFTFLNSLHDSIVGPSSSSVAHRPNMALVSLGLTIFPEYLGDNNGDDVFDGYSLIRNVIKNCGSLGALHIRSRNHRSNAPIQLCTNIVKENHGMDVSLENFRFFDPSFVTQLISNFKGAKLRLRKIDFDTQSGVSQHCRLHGLHGLHVSNWNLEDVDLHVDMSQPWWQSLVLQLTRIPSIQKMQIGFNEGVAVDMTTIMLGFLNENHVRYLDLGSKFSINFDEICEALKNNNSLKELVIRLKTVQSQDSLLDVLKNDNATLESAVIYVSCNRCYDRKIFYYCCLNEYGRAAIRNPETASLEQLVDLLGAIPEKGHVRYPKEGRFSKHDIQHGLLSVGPGLWVTGALSTSGSEK